MRKQIGKHIIWIAFWIGLDQLVKYFLVYIKHVTVYPQNSSKQLISFYPFYNVAGSFLSSAFGIPYSKTGFYVCAAVFTVLMAFCYVWVYRKLESYGMSKKIFFAMDLLLAGGWGRIVDKIFWKYTLDYIAIRYIGICDLLDFYATIGEISLYILLIYFMYCRRIKSRAINIR